MTSLVLTHQVKTQDSTMVHISAMVENELPESNVHESPSRQIFFQTLITRSNTRKKFVYSSKYTGRIFASVLVSTHSKNKVLFLIYPNVKKLNSS